MNLFASALVLASISCSAAARRLNGPTCDTYCNDPTSDYCSDSPYADASVTFPKPSMFAGTNTEYAKCHRPWNDESGKTQKIRCPPKVLSSECESCGYSWSQQTTSTLNGDAPFSTKEQCCDDYRLDNGFRWDYDYKWNIDKARRAAYKESDGSCWGWWGCARGRSCGDRNWYGKGKCKISSGSKFLGDACENSDQCNQVTADRVNMACSQHTKRCMLKEDAEMEHQTGGHGQRECTCSVFDHGDLTSFFTGLVSCKNYKECGGNYCDRTTRDMKFYCKNSAWEAKCSNCRASSDSCS